MSRIIAIDWDVNEVRLVAATIQRNQVTINNTMVWPDPPELKGETAQATGEQLADLMKQVGIASGPALFSINQSKLILKDIRYPDVPANEVSSVVRFQASKELTTPPEKAVIDYSTCGLPWPSGEKRAIAAILSTEVLSAIKTVCKAANLKLESVCPRPFALLSACTGTSDTIAYADINSSRANLIVARGGELMFARSAVGATGSADQPNWAPELRRSLAAYANLCPNGPVQSLQLINCPEGDLAAQMENRLRLMVSDAELCPELRSKVLPAEEMARFAAPLGLLRANAGGKPAIDFLHVKEPPPPDNRKKRYAVMGGIAAAILLLAGGSFYGMGIMDRNSQLTELRNRKTELDKQKKSFGDVAVRAAAIRNWQDVELIMLDELHDLCARFPDQDGLHITKVLWEPEDNMAQPVGRRRRSNQSVLRRDETKPIGRLTLVAKAKSSPVINRLRSALDRDPHWKLDQWQLDAEDRNQATAVLKIYDQEPGEYLARMSTSGYVTSNEKDEQEERGPRRGRFNRNRTRGGRR